MADQYGLFWNSVDSDRLYDADSFAEWLRKFFTTGVFDGELQVTSGGGMDVSVSSGYANINGKVRFFDSATKLTLATAGATYPRIDTIVVERNDTDRQITIKAITGTYSANPTAPAPVRANNVYQIVLAQIYVAAGATAITQANITDTRSDNSICGIVTGTVKEMDYSQFAAQFNAYYSEFKTSNKSDFDAWFDAMKGQLTTDAAGNLQAEIDAVKKSVSDNASSITDNKTAIDANSIAIHEIGGAINEGFLQVFALQQTIKTTAKSITLTAASWSSGSYTIRDSLITATSNQEIIPAQSITADQYKALVKASLVATGQTAGSITIKAFGTTPAINIPVTIIFRGEK